MLYNDGAYFLGWYSENGIFLSNEDYYYDEAPTYSRIEARFGNFDDLVLNEEDVEKLRAFLETPDAEGVKIGRRINQYYDPNDVSTWSVTTSYEDEWGSWDETVGVIWENVGSNLCASELIIYDLGIKGPITLPACEYLHRVNCNDNEITSLNVSNNSNLLSLWCSGNKLTSLDVSSCSELWELSCGSNLLTELNLANNSNLTCLYCYNNLLTSLDVSGCMLDELICSNNLLTELDVSSSTWLYWFNCRGNKLKTLDTSANQNIYFDSICSEGSGTIGLDCREYYDESIDDYLYYYCSFAQPDTGAEFLGWFTETGEFISDDETLSQFDTQNKNVIARFGEAAYIPGDVDGNGVINANDALTVLRAALGLTGGVSSAGDVNGDGVVNANDALMILRAALGLIAL